MFSKKYLLLELNDFEAEFYHLPKFVPYFEKHQKILDQEGFKWTHTVDAMEHLVKEDYCDEYKPYKLFLKKWEYYQQLTKNIENQNWRDAEKNIDKILAVDLLDPSAYYNLGFVFSKQQESIKAEQAYLKGAELTKNQTPFWAGLAKNYQDAGKLTDAMYFWHEVFEAGLNHYKTHPILDAAFRESTEALAELRVYEIPEQTQNYENLKPADNFMLTMERSFSRNYNNCEKLNKIGVKLVHYQLTELAVKVFERVYELTVTKDNPKIEAKI